MEPSQFKGYKMYQKVLRLRLALLHTCLAAHAENWCIITSEYEVNHFPMMAELARKTNLGRNLKRMRKLFPQVAPRTRAIHCVRF